MEGKNVRYECPYCDKTLSSQHHLRHIVRFHEAAFLQHEEAPGLKNLRHFDPDGSTAKTGWRGKPLDLHFPKGQRFYCCFGCLRGFKKLGFEKNHSACQAEHIAKVNEIWARSQGSPLTASDSPSAAAGGGRAPEPIRVAAADPFEDDLVLAVLYKAFTEFIRARIEVDEAAAAQAEEYEDGDPLNFEDQLEDFLGPRHVALMPKLTFEKLEAAHKKHFPKMPHPHKSEFQRIPIKPVEEPAPHPTNTVIVPTYREPTLLPVLQSTKKPSLPAPVSKPRW